MVKSNPMPALYARLSRAGLTRKYVRETALPGWWDDEVASTPAGYAQGLLLLSRHLGLDIRSLQNSSSPIRLREFGVCKYKKKEGVGEDELAMCRMMATRAGQLAAEAMSAPHKGIPASATEIRQTILDTGACWVGLPELLDFCWSAGIPVLHLDHFPKNARRPDGFVARVGGRPVVVLCIRKKQPAWLLFILAHELGHAALGHLPEDGSIMDDRVDEESRDAEEMEANAFAIELLTGSPTYRLRAADRWPNAQGLAEEAKRIGRGEMIDPGHVVLNYAHSMGPAFFGVANAALARLNPDANAVAFIRAVMADRLDWSNLPEDSSEFLMRVTAG